MRMERERQRNDSLAERLGKAHVVVITGSLRNLMKLVGDMNATGKVKGSVYVSPVKHFAHDLRHDSTVSLLSLPLHSC